jgi:hypothetical protein
VSEAHVPQISNDQIRAMFDVFAGAAEPQARAEGTKRRATRRTVVVLVVGLIALGFAVPAALALFGYWETPKQFLDDSRQPAYAKQYVRQWLTNHGYMFRGEGLRLVALTRGITATTPTGDTRVYAVRFAHGDIGFWLFTGPSSRDVLVYIIPTSKAQARPLATVWYRPCPHGWALQYLKGDAFRIGQTPGYTLGRAASTVASVHVLYPDGSTTRGSVADGFFVAWMRPSSAWTNVTVIGKDTAGRTVARLVVGGYGGLPYWSVKPGPPYPCAP